VSPKVDGRIVLVNHDTGDLAIPGSVMLEIDPTDAKLVVAESRSALDADLDKIGLLEIPKGAFDVEKVPTVVRAEAQRFNAQRTYERLKSTGRVSKMELDNAETELKLAEAGKFDAIVVAKATLAGARWRKAILDQAEQRLIDCTLRVPEPEGWMAWAAVLGPTLHPAKYVVAERMISVGNRVQSMPLTNAFKLLMTYALKLRVTIPEKHIPDVMVGQDVQVKVEAYPNVAFPAKVTRVHPTVDSASRAFQAEIIIPNNESKLKPGGFAKASIMTGKRTVTTVPPQAIQTFAGVSKIFVMDGEVAKAVPVDVGQWEAEWVEVTGKIPPGANVITTGFSRVVDGSKVRLRKE
jgi:multidrug efflux pump subunit AcrA (membrane-fusion protein)